MLAGDPWKHVFVNGGEIAGANGIDSSTDRRVLAAVEPVRPGGGTAPAETGKSGRKQPGKCRGRQ